MQRLAKTTIVFIIRFHFALHMMFVVRILTSTMVVSVAFAFLALAHVCVILIGSIELTLNPHSSMLSDVRSVQHHPADRQVQIVLNPETHCLQPTFVVRLSGTALYMAELESHNDMLYTFRHPCIVDNGTYHIEMVRLYCDTFNPSNYSTLCVDSPLHSQNVVNLPYSVHLDAESDCAVRPRWRWHSYNNKAAHIPALLPTRHQRTMTELKRGEHCESGWIPGYCNDFAESDVVQYLKYDWVDAPDWQSLVAPAIATAVNATLPVIRICYVGDSHARELFNAAVRLPQNKHKMVHIRLSKALPSMFNESVLAQHMCSVAVITFGQWMFSNKVPPITMGRYALEVRKIMLQLTPSTYSGSTKIFFRTENLNGLGARYASCPPTDYRSLPAIQMVNKVLYALAQKLDIDFIDMTHIQMVHWDGAPDFNHPTSKVFTAEVEWILYTVLNTTLHKGYNLTTYGLHEEPHHIQSSVFQDNLDLSTALKALAAPAQ